MKVVVTRTLAGGVGLMETDPLVTDVWIAEPGIGPERSELLRLVAGADAVLCQFCERVDAEFFEAAGPQLKVVANYAVGFENLDVEEATRRGVWVSNTPDTVTPSTADMAWALMLGISRRIIEGDREVRAGGFANRQGYDPCHLLGGDFENQTLLIVGAGRIGHATALRSIGWGMKVLYVARSDHPEFEQPPLNATRVTLEQGLPRADYVSLHTPLTEETRHLIGRDELRMMKKTAYLINTARGPVVDEAALVEALREGWIAGAGLDVYEDEPRQHPGLVDLPNTCLMPHVGSGTWRQRPLMAEMAQRNILAALHGERPPNALNTV
ncbi:MAG: D-glycerate dehydrogenase [Planctomycetes bacterium]|nr:D-glycerate dehydrogenase [Planctomycetota bacterium]NOG54329.1 D-glycerate dehydrogenase [Planctomycetota bacterium]